MKDAFLNSGSQTNAFFNNTFLLSTSKETITYCCFSWLRSGPQKLGTKNFGNFSGNLLRQSLFFENFWAVPGSSEGFSQHYTSPVHTCFLGRFLNTMLLKTLTKHVMLESCQTFIIKFFTKIVNSFYSLSIFAKKHHHRCLTVL